MGLRWSQNDPVKTFSRGMVQRLAIARALIGAPRLLLLDEPYTGLDLTGQREVTAIFDAFKAGGGSIVLISHRPDEAYRIAEATLILKGGRIVWWAYRDTVTAEALAAEYLDHLAEGGGPHS
jgi:heme exporter protein A